MNETKASLLKRIVGRLNEVKVVRDFLLILFAILLIPVANMLSDILDRSNWHTLGSIFADNPLIPIALAIPVLFTIGIMIFIHKIDKWEKADDRKDSEKQHNEL